MIEMEWHNLVTRDGYQSLPVGQWEWGELMSWLIEEGCYSCGMDYLTPEEAAEEVLLQMEAIDWVGHPIKRSHIL